LASEPAVSRRAGLAVDRPLWDKQTFVDPDDRRSFAWAQRRVAKDYGQAYWWSLGRRRCDRPRRLIAPRFLADRLRRRVDADPHNDGPIGPSAKPWPDAMPSPLAKPLRGGAKPPHGASPAHRQSRESVPTRFSDRWRSLA
jgi:hypothetical protein